MSQCIGELRSDDAWDDAVPLLRQLWSDADEAHRSEGYSADLLAHVEEWAAERAASTSPSPTSGGTIGRCGSTRRAG